MFHTIIPQCCDAFEARIFRVDRNRSHSRGGRPDHRPSRLPRRRDAGRKRGRRDGRVRGGRRWVGRRDGAVTLGNLCVEGASGPRGPIRGKRVVGGQRRVPAPDRVGRTLLGGLARGGYAPADQGRFAGRYASVWWSGTRIGWAEERLDDAIPVNRHAFSVFFRSGRTQMGGRGQSVCTPSTLSEPGAWTDADPFQATFGQRWGDRSTGPLRRPNHGVLVIRAGISRRSDAT